MRILLTNDDGIYAQGLWALVEALKDMAHITVVAPDREQSGIGTAVTLHHPVRVTEIAPPVDGVKTYAIEGTPSDSVILSLDFLKDEKIDMVISGINAGANLGNDVYISGTVGAALQSYFKGITSVAISVTALKDVRYESASVLARCLVERLASRPAGKPLLLNVNLPNVAPEELEGVEVTRLGGRSYVDTINEGHDGKRNWYWIVRGKPEWQFHRGTDIWAIRRKRVSITPLHTDLTLKSQRALLKGWGSELTAALRP